MDQEVIKLDEYTTAIKNGEYFTINCTRPDMDPLNFTLHRDDLKQLVDTLLYATKEK